MKVYCVKDVKASVAYPFLYSFANADVAKRDLADLLPQNAIMRRFPADFELYEIGEFIQQPIDFKTSVNFVCSFADIFAPITARGIEEVIRNVSNEK